MARLMRHALLQTKDALCNVRLNSPPKANVRSFVRYVRFGPFLDILAFATPFDKLYLLAILGRKTGEQSQAG